MNRKEKETNFKRNLIIEAAEKVFLKKGFDNTKMEDIAKKSEFSRQTLYAYFKNKEDLYTIVFLKHSVIRWDYLSKAMAEQSTGYDKLYAFGKAYYEYADKYPAYMKFMLYMDHNGFKFEKISDKIQEEFKLPRNQSIKEINDAFQLGIEDKTLKNDIKVRSVISYFCMTLRTILNEVVILKYYPKEFYFDYLELFLSAIKG